jgi:hypothetical protein
MFFEEFAAISMMVMVFFSTGSFFFSVKKNSNIYSKKANYFPIFFTGKETFSSF